LPFVFALFVWNANLSVPVDALGYYTGFIIGMLVDIILSAIFSGGAKTVADVLKLLGKQFEGLVTLDKKTVVATGRAVSNLLEEIIAIFAKIRNGAKNIKPFLDEILEFLRVFFGALPKQLYEFFTKFGISIQKVPQGVLYSGIPVKVGDDVYALIKDGKEIFRGTQKEIDELAKKLDELSEEAGKKYLDDLLEQKKLDDFINSQNFKFRKLGYIFKHEIYHAKDGTKEINLYLINKNGEKLWQGLSTISKEGTLFNIFEVSLQQQEVSTAMYKLLDKIGFVKVEASYGSGSLGTNYNEFMKVYNNNIDNRVEAAFATPAGKAINKALDNRFKPVDIIITEKKVKLLWIEK